MVNGNAEPHHTMDDKVMRAPWVEELKMNQAKKNSAQGLVFLVNLDLLCTPYLMGKREDNN